MANISWATFDLFLKKEGEVLTDTLDDDRFSDFRELVNKASYSDPGSFSGGNAFSVFGAWSYVNGMTWKETRDYLKWLFDNGYSGAHIVYDESEYRQIYAGTIDLDLNAEGTVYRVRILSKHWDLETRTEEELEEADESEEEDDFLEHVVMAELPEEGPNFDGGPAEVYWVDMATGEKTEETPVKKVDSSSSSPANPSTDLYCMEFENGKIYFDLSDL